MMREENFNRQNKKTNAAGRFWFPILVLVFLLCGSVSAGEDQAIPEIPGLHFVGQTEFQYAEQAEIYYYEEGFRLIDVKDSARYLVVPEGKEAPEGTEDLVILPEPKDSVYMAATAVMALFDDLFISFDAVYPPVRGREQPDPLAHIDDAARMVARGGKTVSSAPRRAQSSESSPVSPSASLPKR